jgi:purine-nucleoside phosphorylase
MKHGAITAGSLTPRDNTVHGLTEQFGGLIEDPNTDIEEYILTLKAPYSFRIMSFTRVLSSGSLTFDIEVDDVNVTGLAGLTANTSETETTVTNGEPTANVAEGQKVALRILTISSPVKLAFTLKTERI